MKYLPKVIIISILLIVNLFVNAQTSDEFYDSNYLRYDNFVYKDYIQTVVAHELNEPLSYPIIELNRGQKLYIGFDDLSFDTRSYYFTVIHCSADWEPSDLFAMDYIEGFEENDIENYNNSFNTFQKYTHYGFTIPNENLNLKISGNYLVIVYEDNDLENRILTQRIAVVEQQVDITAVVKKPSLPKYRGNCHEIDFEINTQNLEVVDPNSDIMPVVTQNNRHDNAIRHLNPQFVNNNILTYDYNDKNLFFGGNEFHHADLKSVRFKADQIDSIYFEKPFYHFQLVADPVRNYQRYSYEPDLNGKRLIKLENSENSNYEADYVFAHFKLPYRQAETKGNVYIFGSLTNWTFDKKNMMKYNANEQAYEISLFLKQGYYNYEYVFVEDGSNYANENHIEGSHYQTETDYIIYVYFSNPSSQYDKLVGVKKLNSMKKI